MRSYYLPADARRQGRHRDVAERTCRALGKGETGWYRVGHGGPVAINGQGPSPRLDDVRALESRPASEQLHLRSFSAAPARRQDESVP
jgi:hypothetical protein